MSPCVVRGVGGPLPTDRHRRPRGYGPSFRHSPRAAARAVQAPLHPQVVLGMEVSLDARRARPVLRAVAAEQAIAWATLAAGVDASQDHDSPPVGPLRAGSEIEPSLPDAPTKPPGAHRGELHPVAA